MNQGDIVEYQSGESKERATVISEHQETVTVTRTDKPQVEWSVEKERVLKVMKRSEIE